jgi:hypothetical protein
MSSRETLIRKLVNEYDEDENELKELSIAELRERLEEYEDHSDFFQMAMNLMAPTLMIKCFNTD